MNVCALLREHAEPEFVELWDAINQVVAASGGSTSNTSLARQKAAVKVDYAVAKIVERVRHVQLREKRPVVAVLRRAIPVDGMLVDTATKVVSSSTQVGEVVEWAEGLCTNCPMVSLELTVPDTGVRGACK